MFLFLLRGSSPRITRNYGISEITKYHSDNILAFIVFFLQQVINLIGPHLLPDEEAENIASKHGHVEVNSEEFPVSALDANVFRSRSRAFKKSDDAN